MIFTRKVSFQIETLQNPVGKLLKQEDKQFKVENLWNWLCSLGSLPAKVSSKSCKSLWNGRKLISKRVSLEKRYKEESRKNQFANKTQTSWVAKKTLRPEQLPGRSKNQPRSLEAVYTNWGTRRGYSPTCLTACRLWVVLQVLSFVSIIHAGMGFGNTAVYESFLLL